jgi:hypothetical protein
VSIHADDEFSLRIALESELDDVLPSDGLAGLVIARHRKIRRRRVAGVISLVVVCAGIGIPLGLCGPSGKAPQHTPGQRPDQHTGSVPLIPHARTVAVVAGAVSLVAVCAGIRPNRHTGSVTLIPPARGEAALVIELPALSRPRRGGIVPEPHAAQCGGTAPATAVAVIPAWKERDGPAAVTPLAV